MPRRIVTRPMKLLLTLMLSLGGPLLAAPVISVINPNTGPTTGTQVTLLGSGFAEPFAGDPVVIFGNQTLNPISFSSSQIVFQAPPGQGANVPVRVDLDGQWSGAANFSYLPPTLNPIAVNPPTTGGLITLQGSNFGLSGTVSIGAQNLSPVSWSHTAIQVTVPAGQGSVPVTVTVGGQPSTPRTLTYAGPQISSLVPGPLPTAGEVPVTVNGINFGLFATATVNTIPVTVTGQTHNSLTFELPEGQGVANVLRVTVGGQDSGDFLFNYDPPSIGTLSPDHSPSILANQVTIQGANFGVSPQVMFGGSPAPVVSATHDEIVVDRPTGETGCLQVKVTAGGQTSLHAHYLAEVLSSPPGYYIDTATATVLPAPAGRFAPDPDMTETYLAPPGTYTPIPGMSQALPATPGYFVATPGSSAQVPAPAGMFAPGPGAFQALPAELGHYTPVPGMASALMADPGYFVNGVGATAQVAAPVGSYAAGPGASEALTTEPGTFAPIEGCRAAIPAPAGTYVPTAGATTATPVPPGYAADPGGATVSELPGVEITSFEVAGNGDNTLSFQSVDGQNYGLFYTVDLLNYVLIDSLAGTGAVVTHTFTPPAGVTARRFYVVAPVGVPSS